MTEKKKPNEDFLIPVGSSIKQKLCVLFDCKYTMVNFALRFKHNSPLAKKIRAKAWELLAEEINRFKWICEEGRYVYVISHPNYPGKFKVGVTVNIKKRLNKYQTSDPDRSYKLEYASSKIPYYREVEKYIHHKFDNKW